MTINSLFNGIIRTPVAMFGENYPVDTAHVRDGIVNNAVHTADMSGQVRINFVYPEADRQAMGVPDADGAQRLISFGPFPLSIRPDGSSYRLRLRALCNSNDGSSVSFRAVLAPYASSIPGASSSIENEASITTTSTTESWRDFNQLIYMPRAQVAAAFGTLQSPTTVGGSSYTSVQACLASVTIFVNQTVDVAAELAGLYAAEFIG